jgi:hypothetical protein
MVSTFGQTFIRVFLSKLINFVFNSLNLKFVDFKKVLLKDLLFKIWKHFINWNFYNWKLLTFKDQAPQLTRKDIWVSLIKKPL